MDLTYCHFEVAKVLKAAFSMNDYFILSILREFTPGHLDNLSFSERGCRLGKYVYNPIYVITEVFGLSHLAATVFLHNLPLLFTLPFEELRFEHFPVLVVT